MTSANRIKSILSIKSWRLVLKSYHRFDGFKSIWFCIHIHWCAPLGSLDKLHVVPDCGTCFIGQTLCRCRDGTEDNNYNFDKEADPDVFQTLRPHISGCKNIRFAVLTSVAMISCCEASRNPDLPYTLKPAVPPNTVQISTHKPNSLHPQWHQVTPFCDLFVRHIVRQVWCTNDNRHIFLHLDHHNCSLERFTKKVICCLCCLSDVFEVWSLTKSNERSRSLLHYPGLVKPQRPNSAESHRQKWLRFLCSPDDTDSCSNHSHAGCSILWAAYLGGVAQWNQIWKLQTSDFFDIDLSRFWRHPLAWRQDFWEIHIPSIHEFSEQERLNAPYTEWVMISAKTSEQHATVDEHNPEPFGKYR